MRRRQPKIYATLRRRYCTEALRAMGFQRRNLEFVKLGPGRTVLRDSIAGWGRRVLAGQAAGRPARLAPIGD